MPIEQIHSRNSAAAMISILDSLAIVLVLLTLRQLSLGRLVVRFLRIYSLSIDLLIFFE